MTRLICVVALLSLLVGCWPFGKNKEQEEAEQSTEQLLYRSAQKSIRAGNYNDAITKLQKLEARFPFGRYAEQAQLELVYANFMAYQPEAARTAAERFIRLHPQHPGVDYAYYLKGVAAFNEDRGLLDRFGAADIATRDPSSMRKSFNDFSELLARFPDSQYAPDARQRMVYLRNLLARYEINVARFYMRRGAYVAAANRARNVVEHYSQSLSVADALAIMVEANWRLGLPESANDALRVLALNDPHYPAFDKSGHFVFKDQVLNRDRSWLNMMTFGLLDRPDVPPPIEIDFNAATAG
jgi:outer membrane protein assembly factor BamD